jgi:hypothetical protein
MLQLVPGHRACCLLNRACVACSNVMQMTGRPRLPIDPREWLVPGAKSAPGCWWMPTCAPHSQSTTGARSVRACFSVSCMVEVSHTWFPLPHSIRLVSNYHSPLSPSIVKTFPSSSLSYCHHTHVGASDAWGGACMWCLLRIFTHPPYCGVLVREYVMPALHRALPPPPLPRSHDAGSVLEHRPPGVRHRDGKRSSIGWCHARMVRGGGGGE